MFEDSPCKLEVLKLLQKWNHQRNKATPFNIAVKTHYSEDMVRKVLRYLEEVKVVEKVALGGYRLV